MPREICITREDLHKLKKLMDDGAYHSKDDRHVLELCGELARAQVVPADCIPGDVITMNTKVLLRVNGEEEEVTLVYPNEADVSQNCISVLSPIGTAILGYRERDSFEWNVPTGTAQVEVIRVLYQPEAAQKTQNAGETETGA